ncbi:DNA cytosine methyltransferase [Butyricimonas virosa]|jgi:DNA (cytosine-5)-methyltransferase 1|uniref:DNA cytosine methyltransferase n=1 Tax=Butyricimonas virosa TaxID=544645 RepID=UPI0022E7D3F3|nr:DNA cytosine methyltransferase [Butyricimonas virosa]MBS5626072.1 DNA cytosine methyltransferase [Porphyromonadaceae bacterium]MCI6412288.1 DNA cytosine methyltransferase [Butyricimonas virosa]
MKLLYIDLFCGAGGTSTGVETARVNNEKCAKVIACVNHDANAIASHAANHPEAKHFTEDIRTLELSPLVSHLDRMEKLYPSAFVVLWASLECTNFSKAKGGQPRDADSRTLAEHLFRYIEAIKPDYIQIENVEEFMSWGPMDENGKPISMYKGDDYTRWVTNVKLHGYDFEYRVLNAADFGAYTTRKRFFGIFAKKGLPIVFPEPTHVKVPTGNLEKWKPVKDVLDFSDEGISIFERKKPLSEKTLERIYAGLIKFVAGGKEAFMVKWNSMSRTGKYQAPGVDEPCHAVTCQNRLGVARVSFLSKYFSGHPESKNISVEGPAHTIKCKDNHALIISDFLAAYYGNGDNVRSVDSPAPTVTTKDRLSLVSPFFMNYYTGGGQLSEVGQPCSALTTIPKQRLVFIDQQFGKSRPAGTDKPLGTLTTNPKYSLVNCLPWIMNTNFNNIGSSIEQPAQAITANRKWHYLMNPQFQSAGASINKPCFTLIARMDKRPPYLVVTESGWVAIEIYYTDSLMTRKIKEFMALYGIVDIKMRMLKISELKRIMGFPTDYVLIGSQSNQKKFIGNAVEVNMARVLCSALARKLHELNLSPTTLDA